TATSPRASLGSALRRAASDRSNYISASRPYPTRMSFGRFDEKPGLANGSSPVWQLWVLDDRDSVLVVARRPCNNNIQHRSRPDAMEVGRRMLLPFTYY